MRKIVIGMSAGFARDTVWEFYEVPDSVSTDDLSDFAWQRGKDHAESYGVYPREEYLDSDEISQEELDSDTYSDNIEGYWEDYDPKLHDRHSHTGTPHWETW